MLYCVRGWHQLAPQKGKFFGATTYANYLISKSELIKKTLQEHIPQNINSSKIPNFDYSLANKIESLHGPNVAVLKIDNNKLIGSQKIKTKVFEISAYKRNKFSQELERSNKNWCVNDNNEWSYDSTITIARKCISFLESQSLKKATIHISTQDSTDKNTSNIIERFSFTDKSLADINSKLEAIQSDTIELLTINLLNNDNHLISFTLAHKDYCPLCGTKSINKLASLLKILHASSSIKFEIANRIELQQLSKLPYEERAKLVILDLIENIANQSWTNRIIIDGLDYLFDQRELESLLNKARNLIGDNEIKIFWFLTSKKLFNPDFFDKTFELEKNCNRDDYSKKITPDLESVTKLNLDIHRSRPSKNITLATYLKIAGSIREVFAQTIMAKRLGFKSKDFRKIPSSNLTTTNEQGEIVFSPRIKNILYKGYSFEQFCSLPLGKILELTSHIKVINKTLTRGKELGLLDLRANRKVQTLSSSEYINVLILRT